MDDEPVLFEEPIGRVEQYIAKSRLAVVRLERGPLRTGDRIRIVGDGEERIEDVYSLEIDRMLADQALPGSLVGIRVAEPVNAQDDVFLVY